MSGTTPKLALPYPTGTDRVADGDNAIQALAVALDGQAWQTVATFFNGWTGQTPIKYRKDGVGNVHVRGLLGVGTAGQGAFLLPGTHAPDAAVSVLASGNVANAFYSIDVATDGNVVPNLRSTATATLLRIDLVFSVVKSGTLVTQFPSLPDGETKPTEPTEPK